MQSLRRFTVCGAGPSEGHDVALPRMAKLRHAAGYSQRDLAKETGISHRMIAYYEKQAKYPPTLLLPVIVKALGTTADELLGIKKNKNSGKKKRYAALEKV